VTRLLSTIPFLCLIVVFVHESFSQDVIDLDTTATLEFDGEADVLDFRGTLIDGFTYRFPVELRVREGVELVDLHGKTICQCASLQFDKKTAQKNEVVTGRVLLKPKSADLEQSLDAFGTPSGQVDPVRIGRIKLNCKVYAPLRFVPHVIEVIDGRLPETNLSLQVSKGVEIVDAEMVDSNGAVKATFEPEHRRFVLDVADGPLAESQGELVAHCKFTYRGTQSVFDCRVPYAPKAPIRVVPSVATFRNTDDGLNGRLVLIGFNPASQTKPSLALAQLRDGEWEPVEAECTIDDFWFGKAIVQVVFAESYKVDPQVTRMRFTDKDSGASVVEFDCLFR
jgi:hypothetical protein